MHFGAVASAGAGVEIRRRRTWLNIQDPELVFVPLGGVGEIGMNFALYGYGPANAREWIIVDVGVTFPDATLPGVDLVLPDIALHRERARPACAASSSRMRMRTTTARCSTCWPRLKAPCWMTPFAAGLLEAKRQCEKQRAEDPGHHLQAPARPSTVGPFRIEAIPVTHSIPEPVSLAITTPLGTVVHTGDWKLDPAPEIGPLTDEARFRAIGDAGVLALVCDSTNARARRRVAAPRRRSASSLQRHHRGRRPAASPSPPSRRMSGVSARSPRPRAMPAGRCLVLGRSLKRMISVATELGYMDRHAGLHRRGRLRLHPAREPRRHLHRQPGRAAARHSPSCRATR